MVLRLIFFRAMAVIFFLIVKYFHFSYWESRRGGFYFSQFWFCFIYFISSSKSRHLLQSILILFYSFYFFKQIKTCRVTMKFVNNYNARACFSSGWTNQLLEIETDWPILRKSARREYSRLLAIDRYPVCRRRHFWRSLALSSPEFVSCLRESMSEVGVFRFLKKFL